MSYDFKTKVEVSIDYDSVKPKGYSYESRRSEAQIAYRMDLELREWGLKNIIFTMPEQEISCYVELQKDDQEDYESYLFKIKLEDKNIESPEDISFGDISPNELNIEIKEIIQIDNFIFEAKGKAILSL